VLCRQCHQLHRGDCRPAFDERVLGRTGQPHSPIEDIVEGFRWVNRTKIIRALLLLIGLVSLVGMPYTVLMPVFADKILHGGARGLGILMGATGVGALFGALTLAAKTGVKGLGRWVAFTCAGFGDQPVLLFVLAVVLAVGGAAAAGGYSDDVADGLLEYADPDDGAG
jgi:hypothetical protein